MAESDTIRRRPRDRKAQLAAAAAASFADVGYHGVGIDDVAAAVGITGGAVYRHFGNKYELLRRAVFDGVEVVESAASGGASDEPLSGLLERLATMAIARRDLGVLLQRESRHLEPDDQAELRRRVSAVTARLGRLVRDERPHLGDDDVALIARSVLAVLASPSYHRIALADASDARVLNRMVALVATTRAVDADGSGSRKTTPVASTMERASRRETLLSVAGQLFARHGYGAVRMEDVGREAGIAGPSIYQHFESKADLLTAALTRGAEWLQFGVSRALATADTEARALELVVGAYVEFVIEHTDLMALLLTETVNLPDAQRHAVRRLQHDYVSEWVRLLSAARPDVSEPHARFVVHGVLGVVNDNGRSDRARGRADLHTTLTQLGLEVLAA